MSVRLLVGDCRERLRELEPASVHCCVTSPPYFGLRDYGTASWGGGRADCDHKQGTARNDGGRASVGGFNGSSAADSDKGPMNYRSMCGKCGAQRIDRQIGLEATPDAFVQQMVEVFREVRRVLRDDGTLWLNLGDSYTGSGKGGNPDGGKQATNRGSQSIGCLYGETGKTAREAAVTNVTRKNFDLGPKQLIGIPWRVAFALQADGWFLRQDIIWAKPNPMPESVRDRCTKAHEYLFLLSKGPRYHFDAEAIAEQGVKPTAQKSYHTAENAKYDGVPHDRWLDQFDGRTWGADGKRNKRSVWTVATNAFPEAHFATYPPELIEPCILAGCPTGGVVLDPFGGAGTTGMVADRLGRNAVLIELNPEYAAIASRRLHADAGMFAEVAA